jgi:hypothetical protein
MTTSIAIDPGDRHGAVAVVRDMTVLGWAAWRGSRRQSDPYEVAASSMGKALRGPSLAWAVRAACVHLPPDLDLAGAVPVVELMQPHGARKGYTSLCESAGIARAVLWSLVGDAHRVAPREWRPAVLALPGTTAAADSERHAAALWGWEEVRRRTPWPMGEGAAECAAPPAWAIGHVAEAACMAAWGCESAGTR